MILWAFDQTVWSYLRFGFCEYNRVKFLSPVVQNCCDFRSWHLIIFSLVRKIWYSRGNFKLHSQNVVSLISHSEGFPVRALSAIALCSTFACKHNVIPWQPLVIQHITNSFSVRQLCSLDKNVQGFLRNRK